MKKTLVLAALLFAVCSQLKAQYVNPYAMMNYYANQAAVMRQQMINNMDFSQPSTPQINFNFNTPYQAPSTTTSSSNYNSSSSSNSSNRSSTSSSQSQRSCRICHGTKKCWTCNGTRRVANGFGLQGYHECPNCKDGLCSHCHGSGLQ